MSIYGLYLPRESVGIANIFKKGSRLDLRLKTTARHVISYNHYYLTVL